MFQGAHSCDFFELVSGYKFAIYAVSGSHRATAGKAQTAAASNAE
jgi:hypothetical protein